ncbi:MAG: energy transducer TonB [Bryobacteraceae bacterium]|jgi:protein TonB
MGMFEQSLLLDHAAGKKTGALAASLTAQTLAVGVLIAIPLIFSDRLPDVRLFIPLSLPSPPPPPPPEHVQTAASSSRTRSAQARPFVIPTHVSALSQIPDVGVIEAPPAYASGVDNGVPGGTGSFLGIAQLFHEPLPQTKPHLAEPVKIPAKPVPIGGDVQAAKLLKKIVPVYPPLARQARVSGTVQLIGVIAKDGTIQQLQVVGGNPLLVKAALDAVRQWIYLPTLLNGQAVEVIAPIDVIFTLSQ